MKRKKAYTLLIILCSVSILVLQIIMVQFFPEHQGTDDKSVELIREIAPDYNPWISNVWEPASDFSEKLIFFIQASLGLGMIVFYILKQYRKVKEE